MVVSASFQTGKNSQKSAKLKISFSLQKEEDFFENKKKRETLDQVLTQKKAIFGPSLDSTAYIYISLLVQVFWGMQIISLKPQKREADHIFMSKMLLL